MAANASKLFGKLGVAGLALVTAVGVAQTALYNGFVQFYKFLILNS